MGAQQSSETDSEILEATVPIYQMGALIEKLFGPGAALLVEVDTSGACSSECCDEVEVVSSSSSEPHTQASAHESYNTIPPEQENVCSSGISAAAPRVCQASGGMRGMRL